ncbi:MAG: hypothetical protein IPM80_09775 [Proteobacteria bacterium]|nr:hypothetical protein [Pseudomonadota bacterium]MBK8958706.1 hypothetical protein [Pseudomonadota bacterium]
MQDIRELDSRGVAGGFIASEAFRGAAQAQGTAWGFHADSLFVAHPIQDRSDDEMRALADQALAEVKALICAAR